MARGSLPPLPDPKDIPVPDWLPEEWANGYRNYAAVSGCRAADTHYRDRLDKQTSLVTAKAQREAEILAMPRDQRRRALIKDAQDSTPEDLGHIHSVFAFCGFPYSGLGKDVYEYVREFDRASLLITAGKAYNVDTRQWERMGVPYGVKARLVLAYLCSQAVKQTSPEVDVGDSLGEFMEALGFSMTGGSRGTIRPFKQQILNIAAADIRVGFKSNSARAGETARLVMFDSFNIQFSEDPRQRLLWNNRVTFNDKFFKELTRHAQPLDWRIMKGISGSARQIDIYIWLKYRSNVLKSRTPLDWQGLYRQFGSGFNRFADFKRHFLKDLETVLQVFDPVTVTEDANGTLWLAPAPKRVNSSGAR